MSKFIKGFAMVSKYLGVAGFGAGVAGAIEYGANVETVAVCVVALALTSVACVVLHSIKKENENN